MSLLAMALPKPVVAPVTTAVLSTQRVRDMVVVKAEEESSCQI